MDRMDQAGPWSRKAVSEVVHSSTARERERETLIVSYAHCHVIVKNSVLFFIEHKQELQQD